MTTILVVDDNEQNLYQLQVLLGGNGYQVASAANGAEALTIARQNPPDLIVSDVLMPVMDGFTLCREWRRDERLKTIPLVFYTATYTDDRDRDFARSLGAEQFLLKPMDPEDLLEAIRGVLLQSERTPAVPAQPAADAAARLPTETPPETEVVYLKEYNEVLVRKLERKMQQLEQINRELARDAVERREAAESLRESEDRFRSLYQSNLDAILLTTPDGSILSANPACCQMFGLSERAICDAGRAGLVDLADPRLAPLLEARARSGRAHGELSFIRSSGTPFHGEVTSSVFTDTHGRPMTCMVIRDITERKQAEDALRKSEVRLRSYFETSLAGFAITSPTAGWVEVNDRLCEMLGYSREEIDHTTWTALTHPDDMEIDLEYFERVLAGEMDGYSIDKRFIRKNGESIWTSLSVRCVRLPDGAVDYFTALLIDITEHKMAEARTAEQLDELRRWHQATLGREGRVIALKKEVNELLAKAGQPPRYASALEEEGEKSEVGDQ